eukprot:10302022-Alexandrium_andersonii.AAC.1
MSASLVGSEMCIRDRRAATGQGYAAHPGAPQVIEHKGRLAAGYRAGTYEGRGGPLLSVVAPL